MPDATTLPYVTIAGVIVTSTIQYLVVRKTGRDAFQRERLQREEQKRLRDDDRAEQARIRQEDRLEMQRAQAAERASKDADFWREERIKAHLAVFEALQAITAPGEFMYHSDESGRYDHVPKEYGGWTKNQRQTVSDWFTALSACGAPIEFSCSTESIAAFKEVERTLAAIHDAYWPQIYMIGDEDDPPTALYKYVNTERLSQRAAWKAFFASKAKYQRVARTEIGSQGQATDKTPKQK